MGRLIFFTLFCCSSLMLAAQDSVSFAWSRTIMPADANITDFEVDNLGNVFLVLNHTQLRKVNITGDSLAVFNDTRRFGNITAVDASSPLKVLLFYKDVSTIVVLDRFLAIKNIIDLRKNNILQAKAIRLSYDNNIWVYDEFDSRIKKIDDNGKILSQSAELRTVFSETPSFESIFDQGRTLYLYDKAHGWFLFDYYGAFVKKYSFKNWYAVHVTEQKMTGVLDSFYVVAEPGAFDYKASPLRFTADKVLKIQHRVTHEVGAKPGLLYFVLYPGRVTIYAGS